MMTTVLFLHPGMMGVSLAAACTEQASWISAGRSADTIERAHHAGITDLGTLADGLDAADVVVSICPPGAAEALAAEVADAGYHGIYVDANAVSPTTARRIAERFERFVDGSVIGPPANQPGTTRLYLSGTGADDVAGLWDGSVLDARVVTGEAGAASALKMAYASWTKIGGALALAVRGLAAAEGVEAALLEEWGISQPGLEERTVRTAAGVGPKAWRFVGEMHQIAETYEAAELPAGFAEAAADLYERLTDLKGSDRPSIEQVLDRL